MCPSRHHATTPSYNYSVSFAGVMRRRRGTRQRLRDDDTSGRAMSPSNWCGVGGSGEGVAYAQPTLRNKRRISRKRRASSRHCHHRPTHRNTANQSMTTTPLHIDES
jgi:hypothetical protein